MLKGLERLNAAFCYAVIGEKPLLSSLSGTVNWNCCVDVFLEHVEQWIDEQTIMCESELIIIMAQGQVNASLFI